MAESITEGTLKTWSKQVGDSVAADEEVATIETDKIDVSVNAPQAGKIVELLAKEEDTVTVGQDLFRIEPGECAFYIYIYLGAGLLNIIGSASSSSSSDPTPQEQETEEKPAELSKSSKTKDSEEPKDQQVQKGVPPPPPPAKGDKQQKITPEVKKEKPKEKSGAATAEAPKAPGSRNETRVRYPPTISFH